MSDLLSAIKFNQDGLVAVIAVDNDNGNVLMQAWMNAEALKETIRLGEMVYFSRSRQRLWRKGETSGHTQALQSLWLDCDGDALLAKVKQKGDIACHTGRYSCFYRRFDGETWQVQAPVITEPEKIYGR